MSSLNFSKVFLVRSTQAISCVALLAASVYSKAITPTVEVVDRNKINMASGWPSVSQTDLTIGHEALRLDHYWSVSSPYIKGYNDVYMARVTQEYRQPYGADPGTNLTPITGVSTGRGKHYFWKQSNGSYVPEKETYVSFEKVGQDYVLIDGDGTEYRYGHMTQWDTQYYDADDEAGLLYRITYPNGFVIDINRYDNDKSIRTVTSNNGLQLYYDYTTSNRNGYPKYIYGVNNGFSSCNASQNSCSSLSGWPRVTYSWPNNVTDRDTTSYTFSVTDASGLVTSYVHRPHNMFLSNSPNYFARLYGIKENGSSEYNYRYFWRNYEGWASGEFGSAYRTVLEAGVLERVEANGSTWTYNVRNNTDDIGGQWNYKTSTGVDAIKQVATFRNLSAGTSSQTRIVTDEATYGFERSQPYKLMSMSFSHGGGVSMEYDDFHRPTKKTTYSGVSGEASIVEEVGYHAEPCTNRKYCGKPKWKKDGNGGQTDYYYKPETGQLERVVYPAKEDGVRPETRYEYTLHHAWYKRNSSTIARDTRGVYLMTKESYCATGAASGDGCAIDGNEVVIEYDYGTGNSSTPNNLWLKEKVERADGKIRRTCYQYDKYGNQIAETKPKAGLSSCAL